MAFEVKQWLDRIAANPTRRTLTDTTTGTSTTVDVTRAEGAVTQEGTPLGATTFNDLESRIATAFDEKQDVLTAGTNITIENNVISATGGGSGDVTKAYVDEQVEGLQYEIDYRVKKDDYAGQDKTGIVSTSPSSATYATNGQLKAYGMTLEAYNNANNFAFVGKETLENRLAPITTEVTGVKEDLIELDDFIPKGWKVVTDTTLADTVTRLELTTLADGTPLEKFNELFVRVENSTKLSSKMNSLGAKFPNVETTLYSTNDMNNGTIYTIWVKNLGDSLILGMGSKNANTFNNENKTQFTILPSAITNPIPSKITLGSYIWDNTGQYGGELLAGTRVRIFAR